MTRIRGAIENGTWFVDESAQVGDLNPKTLTLAELANYWRDKQVTSKGLPLSPKTLPEQPQKLHQGYSVGWPHLVYVGIALYGGAREKTGGISV